MENIKFFISFSTKLINISEEISPESKEFFLPFGFLWILWLIFRKIAQYIVKTENRKRKKKKSTILEIRRFYDLRRLASMHIVGR